MHDADRNRHYILGFSGGKDSTAAWLYLTRELELPRVTCTFSDTGHESDVTYKYLGMLERDHGLNLVRLRPILADFHGELVPEKICERLGLDVHDLSWMHQTLDMQRLAILKRRFPSKIARFCTTMLKLRPMLRWFRQHCDPRQSVRVNGVRAEESLSRAKLPEWEQDHLSGCPLWRPLIRWTADDVFAVHRKHGVPPNPLYKQGFSRVGCFPCIFATKAELRQIAIRYPEAFDRLAQMEREVAQSSGKSVASFFSCDKTAKRYRCARDPKSGKRVAMAEHVRRWALGEMPTDIAESDFGAIFADLEPEQPLQCESLYGLCE